MVSVCETLDGVGICGGFVFAQEDDMASYFVSCVKRFFKTDGAVPNFYLSPVRRRSFARAKAAGFWAAPKGAM